MPKAKANIDIQILPYPSNTNSSLAHMIIEELEKGEWIKFEAAVAFIKRSGNFDGLLNAIEDFAKIGNEVELIFGVSSFGKLETGTELEAVEQLVNEFEEFEGIDISIYHEPGRTFHPKVYLFSNEVEQRAKAIIGSSNWTLGGFCENVEANVIIELDLEYPSNNDLYMYIRSIFDNYWKEV